MSAPNVVLCLSDMLRPFELGCYGHPTVHTPHLDRLAAEGVRFELAVTSNPVCTPARSSLLSGQYSRTCTGALGNPRTLWPPPARNVLPDPTLAECFRAAGYETALIGKWHLDADPRRCGFDYTLYPNVIHRHYNQEYVENDAAPFCVPEFAPDFERDRLSAWLRNRHRERPFFLFHNISQPHMPLGPGHTPERYLRRYDRRTVSLRPNVFRDGRMAYDREWFVTYTNADYWYRKWILHEPPRPTDTAPADFDLRDLTAYYDGLVTCTDDQVGGLLAALEADGVANNTIVLFLSDHGDNLGSHHCWNKGLLIEESIRIPFLVWAPGRLAPRVNRTHVASVLDALPTLLDLCGLPIPAGVQGRSLRPMLEGASEVLSDNRAFIETTEGLAGIRTPTHTYGIRFDLATRAVTDDAVLFYDNAADPYQQHNLAGTTAQPARAAALRDAVVQWHQSAPWMKSEIS